LTIHNLIPCNDNRKSFHLHDRNHKSLYLQTILAMPWYTSTKCDGFLNFSSSGKRSCSDSGFTFPFTLDIKISCDGNEKTVANRFVSFWSFSVVQASYSDFSIVAVYAAFYVYLSLPFSSLHLGIYFGRFYLWQHRWQDTLHNYFTIKNIFKFKDVDNSLVIVKPYKFTAKLYKK
jgi:hypothetical protein